MRTYQPKIEVRLVKVIGRTELAPSVAAVVERYSQNAGFDLTPFLGENGGVRLSKGVRQPAGGFSITLSDMPHPGFEESLYALIEPMDMLEIRMAHDPYEYAKPDEGYAIPVVMRCLVSRVARSESMQGDKPVRGVTITGHDFGKVLQIIQIFYLNNSVVGDNLLSQFAYFQKYSNKDGAKIKTAGAFLLDIMQGVVAPYLGRMLAASRAEAVGAKKIDSWGLEASIAGSISPFALASMNNVSLHQMLASLLDVGAFNELFVRDDPDGVTLVARPSPMRTPDGAWIQVDASGAPATAEFIELLSEDVVSINVARSDEGVANYYWVSNNRWTMMHNESAQRAAMVGSAADYVLFDYFNSSSAIYGVRKMEVECSLGPPGYSNSDGNSAANMPAQTNMLGAWLHSRRAVLASINKDNVVFESGSLRIRGNERVKAGMYLRLYRGTAGYISEFYITNVDHDYQPLAGFFTTLTVERGTTFIARAQAQAPLYRGEIDAGGVY